MTDAVSDRSGRIKWRQADGAGWVDMCLGSEATRWLATYRRANMDDDRKDCWVVMYSRHGMTPREEVVGSMAEEDVRDHIYMRCLLNGALNEE